MARVTCNELRFRVRELQKSGCDVNISWAYGRPRIENYSGSADLSPRDRTGMIKKWLIAHQYRLMAEVPVLPAYWHNDIVQLATLFKEDYTIRHNKSVQAALYDALVEHGNQEVADIFKDRPELRMEYVCFLILDRQKMIDEDNKKEAKRIKREENKQKKWEARIAALQE